LADIQEIFVECQADRITSRDLAAALAEIETSPWAEWSNGKPITTNKLAHLLGRFGIRPGTIRLADNGKTSKGYYKDDFADAWERYLPPAPGPEVPHTERHNVTTRINTGDSADFESVTATSCDVTENEEIPNKNGPCDVVTFLKPGERENGYDRDASGPGCRCQECGVHYGTVVGWRAHIARGRCTQAGAAN